MNRGNLLIFVLAGALALGAGIWLASLQQHTGTSATLAEQVTGFHGTVLPVPRQLAIPELIKTDSTAFVAADLQGHWSLLFFGYTSCPDICPATMSMLVAAKQKSASSFPQVYFVSVDPVRDTQEKLLDYVKYFDQDFIGITGSKKMLGALALQTSVVFMEMPAESGSDNDYLMDHSSALLMINPEAQLVAFIIPQHTPDSILKAVGVLVNSE